MKTIACAMLMAVILAAPAPAAEVKPEAARPVLLVMDIQNAYLDNIPDSDRKEAFQAVNVSMDLFRHYKFPVVVIYHRSDYLGAVPGKKEFQFPEEIRILETDPTIIKTRGSAFQNTDLEKMLRDKGIDTVFICGMSSVGCVMATYFGAMERNFRVFTIRDALISTKPHLKHAAAEILGGLPLGAVHFILRQIVAARP